LPERVILRLIVEARRANSRPWLTALAAPPLRADPLPRSISKLIKRGQSKSIINRGPQQVILRVGPIPFLFRVF
jgi:hypothetical protein